VLRHLPASTDPNVLVGFGASDDAGIYKLRDDLALVQTVDFFTPIVDDPHDFGRIAAANALSDVYAMGGAPLCALNIVAYPMEKLGPELLGRILAGGAEIAREAGVAIVGGHTVEDDEPKYGLAVTGIVHPQRFVTNAGAKPGDVLVLTKPIGTGILATALKKGAIGDREIATAVTWMTLLNGAASRAMLAAGAHAATDITGYGLLGHAGEMMRASKVKLRIRASAVPVMALVRDMLSVGIAPSGTRNNAIEHQQFTEFARDVSADMRLILSDAQTSGGLLIAVPPENAAALRAELVASGSLGAEIGVVESGTGIAVV
jgi:selenide,water dikinase